VKKPLTIAMVGLGGWGNENLGGLLDSDKPESFRIVAAIDPFFEKAPRREQLRQMKVPVYDSLEQFYDHGHAELVIISTPIHLHCPQSCTAVGQGSYVLCEKPLGATVQEVQRMVEARDRAGKWIGIGYQWSFSSTIQALKRDVQSGLFGRPVRLKTLVLWPRDHDYYRRNDWAGRRHSPEGQWVLDSPVNNAVSHYLHNMFYILGDKVDTSGQLVDVQAELYRANDIENFDTAMLRCHTDSNAEILFYATHACRKMIGPIGCYEFEEATINYGDPHCEFVARFRDGSTKNYGSPNPDIYKKLYDAVDCAANDKPIACGLEAASAQTLCVNGGHDSVPQIPAFPAAIVNTSKYPSQDEPGAEAMITWVTGLEDLMSKCYEKCQLPGEAGIPWAETGQTIELGNYREFPQSAQDAF